VRVERARERKREEEKKRDSGGVIPNRERQIGVHLPLEQENLARDALELRNG